MAAIEHSIVDFTNQFRKLTDPVFSGNVEIISLHCNTDWSIMRLHSMAASIVWEGTNIFLVIIIPLFLGSLYLGYYFDNRWAVSVLYHI